MKYIKGGFVMRKISFKLITLLFLVFLLNAAAGAQDYRGKLNITPFAGIGIPLGVLHDNDFDDANAMFRANGPRFGIRAEYFLGRRFAMGIDFSYASYKSRKLISDNPEFDGQKLKDKMRVMLFGVHARHFISLKGRAHPYVLVGFGFHDIALTDWNVRPVSEEGDYQLSSRPYMQGAFGVQVQIIPSISVSAEAGLTYLLSKDVSVSINGNNLTDPETGDAVEIKKNYYIFDLGLGVNLWFNI
jgi:hypothetical protein